MKPSNFPARKAERRDSALDRLEKRVAAGNGHKKAADEIASLKAATAAAIARALRSKKDRHGSARMRAH